LTGGSPLRRAGRDGLARNAAIVLGNSGDKRYLPVLRRTAEQHDDEVVRETAAWAVRRISDAVR
jgi:epoxyqueuosine reductase